MAWWTDFMTLPFVEPLIRISIVLIFAAISLRVTHFLVGRLRLRLSVEDPEGEHAKRMLTGTRVLQSAAAAVIVVLTALEVMAELGLNLMPLLAAAGIGGIAVGFGAQTLVKDFINGFFLLVENQVRVGDVVEIGGRGGLVESMGFRSLTLRDQNGNVHIIPNGSVEHVTNMTREYSRYVFDVPVPPHADADRVMRILEEIGEGLRRDPEFAHDITAPLEMLGIDRFEDAAIMVQCVITTRPIKQW